MPNLTIVIPVHNLLKRGLKRVLNSVISLNEQKDYYDEIIIVDSSVKVEYDMLNDLLNGYNVNHIHYPQREFNKPLMLNKGISLSNSKYILCTDADYLFQNNFLEVCEKYRNEKRMMFKQVKMLPNMNLSAQKIQSWKFPQCGYNIWGTLANGACQYATKEFFQSFPYPEEMDGFSAMDNLMGYMAYNNGLEVFWIPNNETEILHQRHSVVNKMAGNNREKFDRNQRVLNDYINKYQLPCLFHK